MANVEHVGVVRGAECASVGGEAQGDEQDGEDSGSSCSETHVLDLSWVSWASGLAWQAIEARHLH
jgi:hypothetical protein